MDGLERRYKVRQRRRYQDEVREEKKRSICLSFFSGYFAIVVAKLGSAAVTTILFNPTIIFLVVEIVGLGIAVPFAVKCIVGLIKSISRTTILEFEIDKITDELEGVFELNKEKINSQESVGRSR